jgi:GT2 family glycosyltransferase
MAQAERSGATGIVVIGRNEGERLRHCFRSLQGSADTIVYVDSGSTDGSPEFARSAGARVVQLDLSTPFTAARARNAGFEHLIDVRADVEFVQFVDGDCALRPGWIAAASRALREHEDLAIVCGRRRERFPERSIYNRLCDVEWDVPLGPASACGGDAFVRVSAFRQVGGFNSQMIAGEEPDLCLRLRRQGYGILQHEADMSVHDAGMTRWTQWWQRAVRTGHTTAQLLAMYGPTPEHGRLRRASSALFWTAAVPLGALALIVAALASGHAALAVGIAVATPLAYVALLARVYRKYRRAGRAENSAFAYAVSCLLAKGPESWGMLLYTWRRLSGGTALWIEYKDAPDAPRTAASKLARG